MGIYELPHGACPQVPQTRYDQDGPSIHRIPCVYPSPIRPLHPVVKLQIQVTLPPPLLPHPTHSRRQSITAESNDSIPVYQSSRQFRPTVQLAVKRAIPADMLCPNVDVVTHIIDIFAGIHLTLQSLVQLPCALLMHLQQVRAAQVDRCKTSLADRGKT